MSTRSILMLGGSRQQVVAIEKARELGYRTVVCDYLPDNPGQYVADSFHLVSTTDRDAILEVAQAEGVEGVLAYASDPAAPTAAYVAERLGLPTNPLRAVETLSSKHLFRQHLRSTSLPCPAAVSFMAEAEYEEVVGSLRGLSYPIVVKPTDSSGSKGVSIVPNEDDLAQALELARGRSRNGILIAEQYINQSFPYVIGGDVFVVEGEVVFWGLMSCLRDSRFALVPMGEMMPSGMNEAQTERTRRTIQELVTSLGIRFGEMNVEVMLGIDDEAYVVELGARAGGNMIPLQLSDASGIDLVAANVLCAMGDDPGNLSWGTDEASHAYMTYVLHSLAEGIFEGVEYDAGVLKHVYRSVMYKQAGDHVDTFDGADKALGIVFLRFDSTDELHGFVAHHDRLIRMEVRNV